MYKVKEFEVGQTLYAIPSWSSEVVKIHVMAIVPSCYEFRKLIIFKIWYAKKGYWKEFLCSDRELESWEKIAKKWKK